jgi:NAD(P)-dependent dehydrogenase (short-subunit alcohol dehydrogenase family)
MKVAITGHTSGIGQGLYQYFESQGHEVLGFSRSNGYALPDAEDRIFEQLLSCDVFVNNAQPITSQISLLKRLWPEWKNTDKKIIVIGSISAQLQYVSPPGLEEYQRQKKELDTVCNTLRYPPLRQGQIAHPCSLIAIHPGYVDTNIFSMASPIARPPMDQMLSVTQVVEVVDYVLRSPINIDTIVLRK